MSRFRLTIADGADDPKVLLFEAWAERPDDEGPP